MTLDMADYVLVFDARTIPSVMWSTIGFSAVLAAVCTVLLFGGWRGWFSAGEERALSVSAVGVLGGFGLVLVALVCVVDVLVTKRETDLLKNALRSGAYTQVNGVVENFVPGDREGHRNEEWSVRSGGRVYRYSYRSSVDIPGFHRSAGPVRAGVSVRVADVDGYIARLEIERGLGRREP